MTIPIDGKSMAGMLSAMGGPRRANYRPIDERCPSCKETLFLTEPGIIHHDPMRKRICCPQCNSKGWVYLDESGAHERIDLTQSLSEG